MFEDLHQKAQDARTLLTMGKLNDAKSLVLQIENEADNSHDEKKKTACHFYASTLLTDIGSQLKDKSMISRGIEYLENRKEREVPESLGNLYFNLANGYYYLTELEPKYNSKFVDTENRLLARRYYRLAAEEIAPSNTDEYWATAFWINYGNFLGDNGRVIEAIDAYDEALKLKPNMGEALGNKGEQLCQLINSLSVYKYPLLFEAELLLEVALEQRDLMAEAKTSFKNSLEILKSSLGSNRQKTRQFLSGIQPESEFQRSLYEFSARHSLFLSPVSFIGRDKRPFFGDPMFILGVPFDAQDNMKLRRCISLLNEIKHDYVLGRYFLFQSQDQSSIIDAVNKGVVYFSTYDGAVYNVYVQLLKSTLKQAIAVLDKVAYFIFDFCEMNTPASDKVSFRTIWGDVNGGKLQKAFNTFENKYLFALFTLARDLCRGGDWEWLVADRGIVTHRFLILHDSQVNGQTKGDIPHRNIDNFRSDTLFALKTARAATIYLMLFVDEYTREWARQNPSDFISGIGSEQLYQLLAEFLNDE